MSGIIPRSKAKGTDICAINKYFYIIRSDLGCYMQTSNLNECADISIFSLHPACQNGDHYIGGDSYFHIINGNSCRRVTSLETDSNAVNFSLHPNCQGGDHYFAACGYFYIIFQEKGTYRRTTNMNKDSYEEHTLDPNFRDGLYYWGPPYSKQRDELSILKVLYSGCFSFLKPVSELRVEFCTSKLSSCTNPDLSKDENTGWEVCHVHPDVINFLPGGLSVTKGSAIGMWENIKTITNDSNTPVTWQKRITKKVGYNKDKMTEMTRNWNIASSSSIESGQLAKLIAQVQFSLSGKYGHSYVSTHGESWNEATVEEEQLTLELKPKESVCLWQYKLGLGQEPVVFCRELKITDAPNPPTEVPLPLAQP